jgi:hypothetical protein
LVKKTGEQKKNTGCRFLKNLKNLKNGKNGKKLKK